MKTKTPLRQTPAIGSKKRERVKNRGQKRSSESVDAKLRQILDGGE